MSFKGEEQNQEQTVNYDDSNLGSFTLIFYYM